ncbi:MAG: hypothetical protein AB1726_17085, partial [Planctomycetota bacterium]
MVERDPHHRPDPCRSEPPPSGPGGAKPPSAPGGLRSIPLEPADPRPEAAHLAEERRRKDARR